MNSSQVSVIGMGQMGRAISGRLHGQGWKVNAFNRTWRDEYSELEFQVSDDLKVIQGSTVLILSLFDEHSIKSLLFNENEICEYLSDGSIIIDTTTHNPNFAKFLSEMMANRNIAYLDAPVSGGPIKAQHGKLAMMVGGLESTYRKQLDLLNSIGNHVYYLGNAGSGQAAKLVNQILVGISQLATAEAMTFATHLNLDLGNLIKVIRQSAGDSEVFRRSAPQMAKRKYSHEFQTHLIAKDLREIATVAEEQDLDLPLTKLSLLRLGEHEKGELSTMDAASIRELYLNTKQASGEKD
ncbi:MAG: NAD(P)-dependent oxidoreductase [Candidatus Marinimicrobia bacterium]|jgi:3-hydroxyisobutyrate dehydrogenase-like beta-hydroxyacid dehydrogenase|nr:NAD(P)-dependent oxidoreductase [Candidatus Neomarinimicrobiota bacterium]